MIRKTLLSALSIAAFGGMALAQVLPGFPPGMFLSRGALDGASGPPPVGCSNQLVLDYSNSCALIGQGWGE